MDLKKKYYELLNGASQGLSQVGRNVSNAVGQAVNQGVVNFGNSPIGKGIVNVQRYVESPTAFTQTPQFKTNAQLAAVPGPVKLQNFIQSPQQFRPMPTVEPFSNKNVFGQAGNMVANLPGQAFNDVIGGGVIDPALDIGRMWGNQLTGQTPVQYDQLKSPLARLGYNAAGINRTPQQVIGNIAGVAQAPLSVYGGEGLMGVGKKAVANIGTQGVKQAIKTGAVQGGVLGGLFGTAQGLSDNRNKDLGTMFLEAAKNGAINAAGGAAIGGAIGGFGGTVGKVFQSVAGVIAKARPDLGPEQVTQATKTYLRDRAGKFTKDQFVAAGVTQRNGKMVINDWMSQVDKELGLDSINPQGGFIKPDEFLPKPNGANAGLSDVNNFKTADEFFLRMSKDTREALRNKGIKSQEAIKNYWNTNAKPQEKVLDTLNPTGNVLAEYNAKERATIPLGENITTLAETMGKSPDETITIYRGVSKNHKEINAGDFVTTNYDLAKSYTGDNNVISKKVKLGDILDDRTEPLGEEYIYRPNVAEQSTPNAGLSDVKLPIKNIENPAGFDNPKNIAPYDRQAIDYFKAHPQEITKTPIKVSRYGKEDKMGNLTHFIEDGQHRYQAAKELGMKDIPVLERQSNVAQQSIPDVNLGKPTKTPQAEIKLPKQGTGELVNNPSSSLLPSQLNTKGIVPGSELPLNQQIGNTGGGQPPLPPQQLKSGIPEIDPKKSSSGIIDAIKAKINKTYTESLDRFHPISSIAKKAGEDTSMRRALTGHYGAGSTGQYHVDFELAPILKSVDTGELRKAAIALRDAELKGRGIKGSNTGALGELLGKQGSATLKDPAMGAALKKLYAYQDNLVKEYLVKTGIMSQEAYSAMKAKNQFYVPFKRVMDDVDEWLGASPGKSVGSVGSQNVIKGIKGSERDIQDPLESIIENTYKMVALGKRQEVAKTLVGLKSKLPAGTIQEVKGAQFNSNSIISVFENGKVKKYKVPLEVAEAAKGMNQDQMSTIVNILAAPTRVFRATATGLNPEFMLPNITRDLQSAFVNVGLNPLRFVTGLVHYMKRDDVYKDFLKSGGLTSQISLDRPYLKKTVGEIASNKRGISVLKGGNLFEILAKIGQASEQPTRVAAFQKVLNDSLKRGIPREQALQDAAYAAQEATVNFGRRGSKTQSINAVYAFLNARAQGTDRLIRTIKADPKGATLRLGMLTAAPAIALYAHNRGYQSYNDERVVPAYEKQNNFIIMLSDTPLEQFGGAQYIKIPKGDVGKLANPLEAFMSYADGKGGDVQKSLLTALSGFSPVSNVGDLVPTALRPGVENAANYNFFMDRQIVPESKKNYPAQYQYNKNTSGIYKEIGSRLNVSPLQVENLMRGYLTGFARLGEMAVKPLEKQDNYSGQDINQVPVARRFLGGAVRSEDEQQLNDYFKQKGIMDKVQDIKTGIKYGNIPIEDGMNEINKLLEQSAPPLETKDQGFFGAKSASAAETTTQSVQQKNMDEERAKLQVQMRGGSVMINDKIIYQDQDGGNHTINLSAPTTGKGIDAFSNQNWNISKALDVYGSDIPQNMKNEAYKKLKVDGNDLEYAYKASKSVDVKTQYINSQNLSHDELIKRMITGRVEGINGEQFASNGVIDKLNEQGKLSDYEAKQLKKMKFDKNMKSIAKVSGGGRKIKLPKAKLVTLKIPKAKRVKPVKVKVSKVKQYKLSKIKLKAKLKS